MQPTARSTPRPSRSTGRTPTACDRSATTTAPAACARSTIAREVPPLAGAEVDGGHGHDGGVGVRGHRVRRRGDEREARQARHRRREVAVGGEVAGVGEQHRAPRPEPGRGDQRPEELHRRRVADHRLPGSGADQRAHPVAEALRRRPPAAVLPAGDPDRAPTARPPRRAPRPAPRGAGRPGSCRRGRPRRRRRGRGGGRRRGARSRAQANCSRARILFVASRAATL